MVCCGLHLNSRENQEIKFKMTSYTLLRQGERPSARRVLAVGGAALLGSILAEALARRVAPTSPLRPSRALRHTAALSRRAFAALGRLYARAADLSAWLPLDDAKELAQAGASLAATPLAFLQVRAHHWLTSCVHTNVFTCLGAGRGSILSRASTAQGAGSRRRRASARHRHCIDASSATRLDDTR